MEALRRNLELFDKTQEAQARLQAVMDTSPIGILTCALGRHSGIRQPRGGSAHPGTPIHPLARRDGWQQYRHVQPDGTPTPRAQTTLARVLAGEAPTLSRELIVEQPDGAQRLGGATSTLVRDGEAIRSVAWW